MEKIRIAEKNLLNQFCAVLDPLQRHFFFLAKIPYFYYEINFQSSHLTKKDRRCLQAPMELLHGALNCQLSIFNYYFQFLFPIPNVNFDFRFRILISIFNVLRLHYDLSMCLRIIRNRTLATINHERDPLWLWPDL